MPSENDSRQTAHDRVLERISRKAAMPGGDERILVVDDEPLVQRVNAAELERLGYRVSCARNGEEALAHMREKETDLVLLDMIMPGMDGVETFRRIKEIAPRTKVVVYSGFAELDRIHEITQLGVKKILMKPAAAEDLARTVREVLDAEGTPDAPTDSRPDGGAGPSAPD